MIVTNLLIVLGASWLAGATAFLGGFIALVETSNESESKPAIVHGIVAFGGGILLSAVAFALAPEGISYLSPITLALVFMAGGGAFCALDAYLSRRGGSPAQFMAMLMDFVPEAISMGAVFAHNHGLGVLLAIFIGAQNLPEGYTSFREMKDSGAKRSAVLGALAAISLLGPIAAALGYFLLQNREALTAGIMSFAAGGILYLIFEDIAPKSVLKHQWLPPLGAVLGFVVGMVGDQLIG